MKKIIPLLIAILVAACNNEEIGNAKDVDPAAIYFDYQVSGEEESSNVTIHLRFRSGGPNGTTLLLNDPAKVELDGERIMADSSKFDGAYYEIQKELSSFPGTHIISFTAQNGKVYTDSFSFKPFSISLPLKVTRNDIEIPVSNISDKDELQVLLTDTALYSKGIDRMDTISRNLIHITREDLADVKKGPLHLELIKEEMVKLKNTTREGGRLKITYGVRRELELTD